MKKLFKGREKSTAMSTIIEYYAPFFDLLGNEDRLQIMFMLHGSQYIVHGHEKMTAAEEKSSLKTSIIAEGIGKDQSITIYHLNKLEEGGLVQRVPAMERNKPVLVWRVTDKWLTFASEFELDKKVQRYLKEKHPDLYSE